MAKPKPAPTSQNQHDDDDDEHGQESHGRINDNECHCAAGMRVSLIKFCTVVLSSGLDVTFTFGVQFDVFLSVAGSPSVLLVVVRLVLGTMVRNGVLYRALDVGIDGLE